RIRHQVRQRSPATDLRDRPPPGQLMQNRHRVHLAALIDQPDHGLEHQLVPRPEEVRSRHRLRSGLSVRAGLDRSTHQRHLRRDHRVRRTEPRDLDVIHGGHAALRRSVPFIDTRRVISRSRESTRSPSTWSKPGMTSGGSSFFSAGMMRVFGGRFEVNSDGRASSYRRFTRRKLTSSTHSVFFAAPMSSTANAGDSAIARNSPSESMPCRGRSRAYRSAAEITNQGTYTPHRLIARIAPYASW